MKFELINKIIYDNVQDQILYNRGISDSHHYLNTTDKDIYDPKLLDNIHQGVKLLMSHIGRNNKIYLLVDPDCDGMTSSALFLNYLHSLFPNYIENNVIYDFPQGKEHGIKPERVPEGVGLVVLIDSSSNTYDEHKILHDRGIDVLVLDHHEAPKVSEYACVINNQLCEYPTKFLSGVGIAYKFCSYIDTVNNSNIANNFLDLVALGCIADVMNLRENYEIWHLVSKGLKQINNPFFSTMVERQSFFLGDFISPYGIAFYIAPYVNATIRVGTQDEKKLLFESMLDYRGNELIPSTKRGCKGQEETKVAQACRNCLNIKKKQTKARDDGLEIINAVIENENLLENKVLVVKIKKDYNISKTLTGLIANQIMSEYGRPVLLLNEHYEEDGLHWAGSARVPQRFPIENFREYLENSKLVDYAEGHASAFGISIPDYKLNDFIKYLNNSLKDVDFSPVYLVDFIWDNFNFNKNDIIKIAELDNIWSQDSEFPLIAIEGIKIQKDNIQLMSPDSKPTIKIKLPNGTELIKFKSSYDEYKTLCSDLGCVTINIVGKAEINIWNGNINPQIIIQDYSIINKQEYYF